MKKINRRNRELCKGVGTSFLLGTPALAVIFVIINSYSNRTRTTLILLSAFAIMELIPILKKKRKKEHTIQLLLGFSGGVLFLGLVFWLAAINSNTVNFAGILYLR
ncbi:MAG: hypothetical protein WBF39_08475 [Planococcus donghaensis]